MTATQYGRPYPNDGQWQEAIIAGIKPCTDGWEVTFNDGWCLFVNSYEGTPRVGDTIRTYGRGIGHAVRGVFIAGVKVRYETEAEYDARMTREQHERELADQAKYVDSYPTQTARINALPGPLQKRLFQFRERSPDFGWKFEGYELACAEAAAQIATACERDGGSCEEWFDRFKKLAYDEQLTISPLLSDLSGNMHDFATRQAFLLVSHPELVPKDHGALCLLVGCDGFKVCDAAMAKGIK